MDLPKFPCVGGLQEVPKSTNSRMKRLYRLHHGPHADACGSRCWSWGVCKQLQLTVISPVFESAVFGWMISQILLEVEHLSTKIQN